MADYAYLLFALVALVTLVWLGVEHVAAGRLAVRHRVVVNLTTGQAVRGVLWRRRGRWLVLRDAVLFEPGNGHGTAVDGETIVDRDQVIFVQKLGS